MKQLMAFGFFFSLFFSTFAQEAETATFKHVCGVHHGEMTKVLTTKGLQFSSNAEAQAVMRDIVGTVGLRGNFKIEAADVPNAAAVINQSQRFILYNPKFIQSVKRGTRTNWSAVSILAHEIGHHLNGHTVTAAGSWHQMELEADEFSGFVLRKMGAKLKDAQAAMKLLASANGSATHPGKKARLRAIEEGWNQADEMLSGYERRNDREEVAEEERVEEEVVVEEKAPEVERIVHPAFAKLRVTMIKNPNSLYYITKSNNFVVVKGSNVIPIGKFKATRNRRYPYILKIRNSPELRVSSNGELVNQGGDNIGFVLMID